METTVFDVEADGLHATKIHCLSYHSSDGEIYTLTDYDSMRDFFRNSKSLAGHNIISYDIPTVERILNIKVKARLIDTLALSWYTKPDRPQHSLESYGKEYSMLKKEIEDWEGLTLEEYVERCERDVKINQILWEQQLSFLRRLYGDDQGVTRIIRYLSFKMDCAAAQEATGWKLDVEKCQAGIDKLQAEKERKTEELRSIMPKVPKYVTKTKPKKCFKQDGSLSALGEKWYELLRAEGLPEDSTECTALHCYHEPNPASVPQLKEYLFSLGWVPDEYKFVRNKETGDTKKIPQINTQDRDNPGVSASVRLLFDNVPKLEVLDGLSILNHRISVLKGFMDDVDENGFIRARIQGVTNTLRFKHKVALNLPGVDRPYGDLIRGVLIAPEGKELCGSDMSSLEDKCKQHFLHPYDPEYVKEMSAPDYDPHLALAEYAGEVTPEQVEDYKVGDHEVRKLIKGIRAVYKAANYAAQYGASGFRVAITAGVPKEKGDYLITAYWKKNWAIQRVADDCTVKQCGGYDWLWNPVSKLWYWLKVKKDKFSTLCQGTGAYCFDVWLKHVRNGGPPIVGQFHDEFIAVLTKGNRERCTAHLQRAVDKANKELNLNVTLGIDVQYGNSYSEIH